MSKKTKPPASPTRIEMMSLDDALDVAHRKNPKEHDVPSLIASFKRFGFVAAPTIDEATSVMVAGHGRCVALAQMRANTEAPPSGIIVQADEWYVPIVRGISFKSERERDAYVIADNQHTIKGGWNLDSLTEMLKSIEESGFKGMGFDSIDLQSFGFQDPADAFDTSDEERPKVTPIEKKESSPLDEDEVPARPSAPVTQRGDIWKLGDSLLICNDCSRVPRERLALGTMGFGFTSPPYNAGKNVERAVHGKDGGESRYQDSDDSMDSDEYAELLNVSTLMMIETCRIAVVNLQSLAQNKRVIARWAARFADHLVDRVVWVKTTTQPAINKNVLNSKFEDLYIYANARRPKRTIETARFHGTIANVHEGATAARDNEYADIHGATMPVHLAQFGIEHLGARADFVVDPFGGTGTTLVVAVQLGKRAALVEVDPGYCDVIVERWKKLTGGQPQRVSPTT